MSGIRRARGTLVGLATTAALLVAGCAKDAPQDSLKPEGPAAQKIFNLMTPVYVIAGLVFLAVLAACLYVPYKFRARDIDGEEPEFPEQVHGNFKLEIGWTVLPAVILAFVAFGTVAVLFDLAKKPEDPVRVEVIGQQWWWEYRYDLDNDGKFGESGEITTANDLVIPAGRPVALSITARDVIHSFWVPALNGKRDAVPGRVHPLTLEADKPGEYVGQCTEYCGLSHANMRLRVIALEAGEYDEWVENQQRDAVAAPTTTTTAAPSTTTTEAGSDAGTDGETTAPSGPTAGTSLADEEEETPVGEDPELDQAIGAELFISKGCSGCHAINGLEGANGQLAPNLTHLYSRKRFAGAVFELNNRNLRRWLRNPPEMKPMNPDNGMGMPNLGLSEDEITQLIAYLETLK
jgi:cytochrome c oxidase subunit 2